MLVDPSADRRSIKRMLAEGTRMRLIEVHNGMSTIIANSARDPDTSLQFDGVWISSLTCMASFGLPDLELALVDNRLNIIEQVTRVSNKPVVVDGGTGGDASSLRYLCGSLQRLGVGAVILEDKAYPKRNSLVASNQELMAPEEFAEKIWTAKDAVGNGDLMIIGRIESLISGEGVEMAASRARSYVAAGADGILIHSKASTANEIVAFAEVVRGDLAGVPLFCVPTTYYGETAGALFAAGFQGVIYANHQMRAAHAAMERACISILSNDCSTSIERDITPTRRIFDDVGYTTEMQRLEDRARERNRRATHV